MAKTMILVAAVAISGGILAKGGTFQPAQAAPGEELTTAKLAALGLDEEAVEALEAKGHVERVPVRSAEEGVAVDDGALAAANKRADDAEAKVAELTAKVAALEADLAAATAPSKNA